MEDGGVTYLKEQLDKKSTSEKFAYLGKEWFTRNKCIISLIKVWEIISLFLRWDFNFLFLLSKILLLFANVQSSPKSFSLFSVLMTLYLISLFPGYIYKALQYISSASALLSNSLLACQTRSHISRDPKGHTLEQNHKTCTVVKARRKRRQTQPPPHSPLSSSTYLP